VEGGVKNHGAGVTRKGSCCVGGARLVFVGVGRGGSHNKHESKNKKRRTTSYRRPPVGTDNFLVEEKGCKELFILGGKKGG